MAAAASGLQRGMHERPCSPLTLAQLAELGAMNSVYVPPSSTAPSPAAAVGRDQARRLTACLQMPAAIVGRSRRAAAAAAAEARRRRPHPLCPLSGSVGCSGGQEGTAARAGRAAASAPGSGQGCRLLEPAQAA